MIFANKAIVKDFKKHPVKLYPDELDQLWITAEELGNALGYADPRNSITRLFRRHKDILQGFSGAVKLTTPGGKQEVTVFNEIGANIIAMKSNTREAKAFIVWAAKIISDYRHGRLVKPQKLPSANLIRELRQSLDKNTLQIFLRDRLDITLPPSEIVKTCFTANFISPFDVMKETGYSTFGQFWGAVNSGSINKEKIAGLCGLRVPDIWPEVIQ